MGAYRLVRKIATGGMAEVFLGKVVGLDGFEKPVAVKRILPHLSDDPIFVSLFLEEAKLTVSLQHANVVQVFDLGALRGQYYMVLEFIDGENLRSLLTAAAQRKVPMALREACFIALQVAEGLAYAHERRDPAGKPLNIVHRDVNPTNVMINRTGEVKLADFGIAKASTSQSHTQVGTIKTKTGYLAPEQAIGGEPDQRSDVFLLGLLLYELMAGRKLFHETDLIKSIREVAFFDPLKLPRLDGVPAPLWELLLKAIAPRVADRTQTAREFANQLTTFLFDNRLRVGAHDIAGLFARALPAWRSQLEVAEGEAIEEIQLSGPSATPTPTPAPGAAPPLKARPEPGPAAPQGGRAMTALPTASERPGPPPKVVAPRKGAGEFELPEAPAVEEADLKVDRKAKGVVQALLASGKLARDQLPKIADIQKAAHCDYLEALVKSGAVSAADVVLARAEVLRVPYVSNEKLEKMPVPEEAIKLVSAAQSKRLNAVPIAVRGSQLFCAMADASDLAALDQLKFISGKTSVVAILATAEGVSRAWRRFYGSADDPNAAAGAVQGWTEGSAIAAMIPHRLITLDLGDNPQALELADGQPAAAPAPAPTPPPAAAPAARPPAPPPAPKPAAAAPAPAPRPAAPVAASPVTVAALTSETIARAQERILVELFSQSAPPLSAAPALVVLAQRLATRLGAREPERDRVGAAAAALAVAGRREGRLAWATPSAAALQVLLGAAYEPLADLLGPATQVQPIGVEGAGPLALATAQRFCAAARSPAPSLDGAKAALQALRGEALLPRAALDALAAELSDRYVKRPRVLVALKDAATVAELSRLLAAQGYAAIEVRSRLDLDQMAQDSAIALLVDRSVPDLGTPEAIAGLRRDPRLRQLPIVFIAASADAARGLEAGADDVFTLPLSEPMVVAKLKRFAQRRT